MITARSPSSELSCFLPFADSYGGTARSLRAAHMTGLSASVGPPAPLSRSRLACTDCSPCAPGLLRFSPSTFIACGGKKNSTTLDSLPALPPKNNTVWRERERERKREREILIFKILFIAIYNGILLQYLETTNHV